MENLRPELTPLPYRIQKLPVLRGYPVPWFVAKGPDGEYDFRLADPMKFRMALSRRLCWVCGERLGVNLCFVLGPMCAVNRTTAEPACHYECALWSAINCPFLARPKMVRRENDIPEEVMVPGESIRRNPGCCLLWTTKDYSTFLDNEGHRLIEVGLPDRVEAYAEGKPTTYEVVLHSLETGEPFLREACEREKSQEFRQRAHHALTEGIDATKEFLKLKLNEQAEMKRYWKSSQGV